MMRKILSRRIAAVAAVVYNFGVSLYRLSDRIDGWNEEDEATEVQQIHVTWPTVHTTSANWTVSGSATGKSGG